MKTSSLIGHAAEAYKIALKSRSASDFIVSQFFRKKKYLGSKDRKFVSEAVFAALRNSFTASEVVFRAVFSESERESFRIGSDANRRAALKDRLDKALNDEFSVEFLEIVATVIFSFILSKKDLAHKPIEELGEYFALDEIDFLKLLENALSERFPESGFEANRFVERSCEVFNKLDEDARIIAEKPKADDSDFLVLEKRFSFPAFALRSLATKSGGLTWAVRTAESLTESAPLTIRCSSDFRNKLIEDFAEQGLEPRSTEISPAGIVLGKRTNLLGTKIYKNGLIEIQDEGSQLISFALAPEAGSNVLDACAGAGGKTLHIASITEDSARIVASDYDGFKLKKLRIRAARYGFKSIETITVRNDDELFKKGYKRKFRFEKPYDFVIVDAPCSGSGTARRAPMQKLRLTENLLRKNAEKQFALLRRYSRFVAQGGVLVYSTCSIMPEENDEIAERFLEESSEFSPEPLAPAFERFSINIPALSERDYKITFSPADFGFDGFFIAKFKKAVKNANF